MKRTSFVAAMVTAGLMTSLIAGCESSKAEPAAQPARADVMDLNDTPAAPIPPAAKATPAAPADEAPANNANAVGPRKHTVAAKDTLYSLAKTYYGDAKQWKKIVDANPGLVPERLPVGKTIVIP